jgi:hypothetical protein
MKEPEANKGRADKGSQAETRNHQGLIGRSCLLKCTVKGDGVEVEIGADVDGDT